MSGSAPPVFLARLMERLLDSGIRYAALGDFEERFRVIARSHGRRRACAFFWIQVILLVPPFLNNLVYWSVEMLKNYLKTALRNIEKHKAHTFINILGLTVGLTFFILIGLYVRSELSYDKFHENKGRIYRVEQVLAHESSTENTAGCPTPLSGVLPAEIPEIESLTRVLNYGTWTYTTPDGRKFKGNRIFAVDAEFLEIFTFSLVKGDGKTALADPYSVVITETQARKMFIDQDPVGQVVRMGGRTDVKITGIIRDVPANSNLQFDTLLSVATVAAINGPRTFTRWADNWVPVYAMLRPGSSFAGVNEKIRFLLKKYQGERSRNELYLRPLDKIHLYANVSNEHGVTGSIKNIYIFGAVSILVLALACINFMNLATARSMDRAREVALRKTVGASRSSLVKQFFGESTITAVFAMLLALAFARILLPRFNPIVSRQLSLNLFQDWGFTAFLAGVMVFVSLASGLYPAIVLSSFSPIRVLGGLKSSGTGHTGLRKALVVFQFSISITLIIGAIIILQQNRFLLNKDLGYSSDQTLYLSLGEPASKTWAFRQELLMIPNVLNVAFSDYLPHSSSNWCYVSWEGAGPQEYMKMNVNYVDENFLRTYGMTIVEGRDFSEDMRNGTDNAVILNETAARKIGWEQPVGKRLLYNIDYKSRSVGGATIVGIVKDFHFLSLHHTVGPIMLRLLPRDDGGSIASVKIGTNNIAGPIASVQKIFQDLFPDGTFSYQFLDEDFQQMYLEEKKAGRVVTGLALMAVLIACLGLVGLSSYMTKQRVREIGIRKVMGASSTNISWLLSREFLRLVVLANILAWPAAYFAVEGWLRNFPYRVKPQGLVFVVSGCFAVLIAVATVGFQAVRAARANPAISLRNE
ncbi:MAG: ABC transporter permease [Candidatus Aminicenantales bacterium]